MIDPGLMPLLMIINHYYGFKTYSCCSGNNKSVGPQLAVNFPIDKKEKVYSVVKFLSSKEFGINDVVGDSYAKFADGFKLEKTLVILKIEAECLSANFLGVDRINLYDNPLKTCLDDFCEEVLKVVEKI